MKQSYLLKRTIYI